MFPILALALAQPPDEGFTHAVLANGLTVSVLADPLLPITATQHWVHVGGSHERADQRGFAHLFEHMMFSATATRPRGEYARFHTRVGGSRNAYTSYDETVYVSAVPPEHHGTVLAMEAERLRDLVLDPDEMAKDRQIVTEELRRGAENTAEDRLVVAFVRTLLADHPYAHSPLGTKEAIAARTIEEARAFYEAYYRPDHLHLVVVGPVDREEVLEQVRALYGDLLPSGVAAPDVPALTDVELPTRVTMKDKIPPVLGVGLIYPMPPQSHPDTLALAVMSQLLSGSQLDVFRERHLDRVAAIEAGTFRKQEKAGGVLIFGSAHFPFRTARGTLRRVHDTVDALGDGAWITQEALDAVRRRNLVQEHFATYYAESRAKRIGDAAWHQGDVFRAFDAAERLAALTPADIERVWRTWVAEATPSEAVVRRGRAQEVDP